jgi:hypothetical protein
MELQEQVVHQAFQVQTVLQVVQAQTEQVVQVVLQVQMVLVELQVHQESLV